MSGIRQVCRLDTCTIQARSEYRNHGFICENCLLRSSMSREARTDAEEIRIGTIEVPLRLAYA